MRTRVALCGAVALVWAGSSCSSGPRPPEPGTPAFYWSAAKATYGSGDFRKTSENLAQLKTGDSEFAGRARSLSVVISAGLAKGYYGLAEAYEAGARANRANPTPFRKQVSNLRSLCNQNALDFAETVRMVLQKDPGPQIQLACGYPTGSMSEPPNVRKIADGMLMQDSERDLVENAMLQRGVLLAMSGAVGASEDSARTLEIFKSGEPGVPRATFLLAAAQALYDLSPLYAPTRLDLPNRLELLCRQALDTLKTIPETKETKALTGKIQASLKKVKGTT